MNKTQLKQMIEEQLDKINDMELGHPGATEETQAPIEAVFDHLAAALDMLWELPEGYQINRDAPIALADLDSKVHQINRRLDSLR